MKAVAAIDTLLIVGMTALAAITLAQVPGEITDLQKLAALSSADSVAQDISGLITVLSSSPSDISVIYHLPEKASYKISISSQHVYVTAEYKEMEIRVEKVSEKLPFSLTVPEIAGATSIEISKTVQDGNNVFMVKGYA